MKTSRYGDGQILTILKQAENGVSARAMLRIRHEPCDVLQVTSRMDAALMN